MEINTGFIFSPNFQHASASQINQTILARAETQNYLSYTKMISSLPTLNSQCMNVVAGQPAYESFAPKHAGTKMQNSPLSLFEYTQVVESLSAIPIYDEVLKDKKVIAKYSNSKSNVMDLNSNINNIESEVDFILRKRRAVEHTVLQDQESTHADSHSGSLNFSSMILSKQFDKMSRESSQNGVSTIYQPIERLEMPVNRSFKTFPNYGSDNDELYNLPVQFQISESSPIQRGYYKLNHFDCFSKNSDSSIDQKTKVITKCEHKSRKHYAKGMCSTCYHKLGRTKTAWNCDHRNELHYAKGCCQDCYLIFHSKRGKNKLKKLLRERRRNNVRNQNVQNDFNSSANSAQF